MHFFKKKMAVILAVCMLIVAIPCGFALARNHVEVDRECTVRVDVPDTMEDLKNATIEMSLYRVATIDRNGEYSATEAFTSIADAISSVSSETTADDWAAMAEEATKVVEAFGDKLDAVNFNVTGGSGTVSGVQTGLYLVSAKETKTNAYGYKFTSYLVSLPNNEYAMTGSGSDEWNYDNIVIGLKPEQYELKGDLEIIKTLKTLNATMGTPLFVFDVEATDDTGKVVFSDVVSIAFDAAGLRKAVVKDIPAGSKVTVTEVYSGASYDATSAVAQDTTIVADDIVSVNFVNDYNDKLVYSTGVVNHFEYDGNGWEWHQITDNE